MSKYTTELRFYCESLAGYTESQGLDRVEEIISSTWENVFSFDFPIFDEEYRPGLCQKIILHYYTREIGFETIGLFKLKLMAKMREIMPKYNELYRSTLAEYDMLTDVDYRIEHEGANSRNSESEYNGENSGSRSDNRSGANTHMYSDTPQGSLVNVNNGTYLTNASKDDYSENANGSYTENRDSTETMTANGTDSYINRIVGKYPGKSYATMIKEFRDNIINVDMMVLDELSDLFMKLW